MCTLLHHLSQRFDIVHKAENVEFGKEMIKEFGKDVVGDTIMDEYEVKKILFITKEMQQRY